MNRFVRLLTRDWRRKLVALGLAFLLWGWVEGRIERNEVATLRVVVTEQNVTPEEGTLTVRVPPGWVLIQPPPESGVRVWLRGSRSVLRDFTGKQFAAFHEVRIPDLPENQFDYTERITPKELAWRRPEEAQQVLDGVDALQELTEIRLERLGEAQVALEPALLRVEGEPAENYEVLRFDAAFDPSQVTVRGPHHVVEAALDEVDAALRDLDRGSSLLEPVRVGPTTRRDLKLVLELGDTWRERGLTMRPERVEVTLPVRLRGNLTHEWTPRLEVFRADPPRWQPPPSYTAPWRALLKYDVLPPDVSFDTWVEEHVVLVLPLSQVPDVGLEQADVPVVWILVAPDLTHEERREIYDALEVEPVDPADATVTVTRAQS